MEDYVIVSCDFYDEITNAISRKNLVRLVTEEACYEGLLKDVYTKNKEEFCVISESHIRLDKIIEMFFDGKAALYLNYSCQILQSK